MVGLDNPLHLLFLLLIVLLLFGAKRLPEFGRSLGQGMRSFRDALHGPGALAGEDEAPQRALGSNNGKEGAPTAREGASS